MLAMLMLVVMLPCCVNDVLGLFSESEVWK